jgi:hypothetical protein
MTSPITVPEKAELYIPDLDNHVLIENNAGDVVIRATRNNISAERKECFIRHLAAEGYIPDRYGWFSEPVEDGFLGVKWIAGTLSEGKETVVSSIRRWRTRRNAWYGCLFVLWLIFFVWAARRTSHGL